MRPEGMPRKGEAMDDLPVVDEGAIERLKEWGGEELPRKMIELFLDHSGDRLRQIRDGLTSGDAGRAEAGAHSLKSSAGNVGAVRLQKLTEKAEITAEKEDMDGLRDLVPAVEKAHGEAVQELRRLVGRMES